MKHIALLMTAAAVIVLSCPAENWTKLIDGMAHVQLEADTMEKKGAPPDVVSDYVDHERQEGLKVLKCKFSAVGEGNET